MGRAKYDCLPRSVRFVPLGIMNDVTSASTPSQTPALSNFSGPLTLDQAGGIAGNCRTPAIQLNVRSHTGGASAVLLESAVKGGIDLWLSGGGFSTAATEAWGSDVFFGSLMPPGSAGEVTAAPETKWYGVPNSTIVHGEITNSTDTTLGACLVGAVCGIPQTNGNPNYPHLPTNTPFGRWTITTLPKFGCMTSYPMYSQLTTVGTGATDTVVSQFEAPCDLKIYGAVFSAKASAAGNTMNIAATGYGTIVSGIAVTSTAESSVVRDVAAYKGIIPKGTVIQLRCSTGGTAGFTNPFANLICAPMSSFYPDSRYDYCYGTNDPPGTGYTNFPYIEHAYPISVQAGPVVGGIMQPLIGHADVGTGQTNDIIQVWTAPCNGHIVGAQAGCYSSAAGNSAKFHNLTQGVDITGALTLTSTTGPSTDTTTTITTPTVVKGDVIQLLATTGATAGMVNVEGNLCMYTQGFLNDTPELD